jgi:hypothetical protein
VPVAAAQSTAAPPRVFDGDADDESLARAA